MNSTYAQKSSTVQKAADTKAASVLDSSAQNESLQRKADMANNAAQRAEAPRPNNTGMPDNLKAGIESLSGFSMDNVRVHYNSSKPATVQALAYTQGTDIHVAPGQEKCLPHEAWHVAQQMAGRVSPTTNINGMPVNDNAALEHEADVMGEKAVTQRSENIEIKSGNENGDALQLKPEGKNDLICSADILYKIGTSKLRVKGVGCNDSVSSEMVKKQFEDHELRNLYELKKTGNGNPPGQCAEPHAVADALKKIPNVKASDILDIFVGDSVIRKHEENHISSFPAVKRETQIKILSRCDTCKQWIDDDGHVKLYYLQGNSLSTDDSKIETSPAKPESSSAKLQIEESFLKKFGKCDENGRMFFCRKEFKNIDFLKNNKFPIWFIRDEEVVAINKQVGLRTIVKKQLLKNRAVELYESLLRKGNIKDDNYINALKKIKIMPKDYDFKMFESDLQNINSEGVRLKLMEVWNSITGDSICPETVFKNLCDSARKELPLPKGSSVTKALHSKSKSTEDNARLEKVKPIDDSKKQKSKFDKIISCLGRKRTVKSDFEKFYSDYDLFLNIQNNLDICKQIDQIAENKKQERKLRLFENKLRNMNLTKISKQTINLLIDIDFPDASDDDRAYLENEALFIQQQQRMFEKSRRRQQRDCNRRQQQLWRRQTKRKRWF